MDYTPEKQSVSCQLVEFSDMVILFYLSVMAANMNCLVFARYTQPRHHRNVAPIPSKRILLSTYTIHTHTRRAPLDREYPVLIRKVEFIDF